MSLRLVTSGTDDILIAVGRLTLDTGKQAGSANADLLAADWVTDGSGQLYVSVTNLGDGTETRAFIMFKRMA